MPDVVAAKRKRLTEVSAQTTLTPQADGKKGYAFNLHTANYNTFAADLQERSETYHMPDMYMVVTQPMSCHLHCYKTQFMCNCTAVLQA